MFADLSGKTALVTGHPAASAARSRSLSLKRERTWGSTIPAAKLQLQKRQPQWKRLAARRSYSRPMWASPRSSMRWSRRVLEQFGELDIFVNNAGITRDNLIMRMKEEEFDQVIETNLKGVFNGIKAVTRPMMKQRSGRIINISSVVGATGQCGTGQLCGGQGGRDRPDQICCSRT